MITLYENEPWGFDNGAYVDFTHGRQFDDVRFNKMLHKVYTLGIPYLAVAPDIVAGGLQSLEFSLDYMRWVLPHDWPWYLAVQDGMTIDDIKPYIDKFSGVFLGGSDAFKWTAKEWCDFAHDNGKKFHFARVNPKRLIRAKELGADSVDGTGLLWEQQKFNRFVKTYYCEDEQLKLFG